MKKLVTLLFLLVVCLLSLSATTSPVKPQVWEYKFEVMVNEKKANQLGAEGWEPAAVDSASTAGTTHIIPTYVFKRPR